MKPEARVFEIISPTKRTIINYHLNKLVRHRTNVSAFLPSSETLNLEKEWPLLHLLGV